MNANPATALAIICTLAEQVDALTAERDRLLARLAVLEAGRDGVPK